MDISDIGKYKVARVNALGDRPTVFGGGVAVSGPGGIVDAKLLPFAIYDVVPNAVNTYIAQMPGNAGSGYSKGLTELTGNIFGNPSQRWIFDGGNSMQYWKAGAANVALPNDCSLRVAGCLSDGSVYFNLQGFASGFDYLFKTNATRTNFGSDAAFTNKRAVLNMSDRGGTEYAGAGPMLSRRSLCEYINPLNQNQKSLLFGNYNVATGRTSGSANDFVRVLKSDDGGLTWSTFFEFSDGTTNAKHFHGIVQSPWTGHVYFMTGDDGPRNSLICWDGIAAAPPLNTTIAQIASGAYPGWSVLSGSEQYRMTDLLCAPHRVFTIPDSDSEGGDNKSTAFVAMSFDPLLRYRSIGAPVDRLDRNWPMVGCRTPDGISIFVSAHGISGEENFRVWLSTDDGLSWRLAGYLKSYRNDPSRYYMPQACFYDKNTGYVIIPGTSNQSVAFTPTINFGNASWALKLTKGYTPQRVFG